MMRCSLIIYQPFCHFLSPCYDCVPCSCVRPGIQCGLSVRGTFRVSQTVPVSIRSISLPGLSVWLPLGCPGACPQRVKHQLSIGTLPPFHPSGISKLTPPADARLQDFPECTTLRSHRRHCHFKRVHPRAPTLYAQHSQPCRSTLTLISQLSGGHQVNPLPSLFMIFLQRRRTSFHSLPQ